MGGTNAIVWGRAKQYHVAEFPGPLSVKTVVRLGGVGHARSRAAGGPLRMRLGAV
jgi:hypothetical protein